MFITRKIYGGDIENVRANIASIVEQISNVREDVDKANEERAKIIQIRDSIENKKLALAQLVESGEGARNINNVSELYRDLVGTIQSARGIIGSSDFWITQCDFCKKADSNVKFARVILENAENVIINDLILILNTYPGIQSQDT